VMERDTLVGVFREAKGKHLVAVDWGKKVHISGKENRKVPTEEEKR